MIHNVAENRLIYGFEKKSYEVWWVIAILKTGKEYFWKPLQAHMSEEKKRIFRSFFHQYFQN